MVKRLIIKNGNDQVLQDFEISEEFYKHLLKIKAHLYDPYRKEEEIPDDFS